MNGPIRFRTLASSSSGNAHFVRIGDTRLLIDVGLSLRRIEAGLEEIDESIGALDAVVLTHEHSDHVDGLHVLLGRRPELRVWGSAGTLDACKDKDRLERAEDVRTFAVGDRLEMGAVTLSPFPLEHDAAEPTGFRLEAGDFAMAVATDTGWWTDAIVEALEGCRLVVLEANHDTDMLYNGPYPYFLKRRIGGVDGHLSNEQALAVAERIAGDHLEHLVLAHLSEKNNDPELAVTRVREAVASFDTDVVAAARKSPSPALEF